MKQTNKQTNKRKLHALIGVAMSVIFIVITKPAFAEVDCTGTVTTLSLQLSPTGTVILSLNGGPSYTYLCDVNGVRNGIPAEVCKAMFASLTTAKITGKKVLIRFYDHNSCSAIPVWTSSGTVGWTQLYLD